MKIKLFGIILGLMVAYNLKTQDCSVDTLNVSLSFSLKKEGRRVMIVIQNKEKDSVFLRSTYAIDDPKQLNNIEVFYRFNGGEWEDRVLVRNVDGSVIGKLVPHPFIAIAPKEEAVFPFISTYNMNYEIYAKIQASVLFRGRSFLLRTQTPILKITEIEGFDTINTKSPNSEHTGILKDGLLNQ